MLFGFARVLGIAAGMLLAGPMTASASPRNAEVYLDIGPELLAPACPSAQRLGAEVEERLGRPLAPSPDRADLHVQVRRVASNHFAVELQVFWADGTFVGSRRIDSEDPDCAKVAEGLPLVIAMLAELHSAELQNAELQSAERKDADAKKNTDASAQPEASPALATGTAVLDDGTQPPFDIHMRAYAGLGADVGALPGTTWIARAGADLEVTRRLTLGMQLSAALPHRAALDADVDAELWAGAMALRGCLAASPRKRWGGCASGELGMLSSRGAGISQPESDRALMASTSLGPFVELPVGPLRLRWSVEAAIQLRRQRLRYEREGEVRTLFESQPVSLRTTLSVGFWSGL